ncbi:MAG: MgtC/SapB family protein [Acidobacteriota bacterium]
MDLLWQELSFGIADTRHLLVVALRLLAAVLLGAAIGFEREKARKPAGLRTHLMVTLGTTVFVLACTGYGMNPDALSRVVQGVVTGIGFIGAGAILKLSQVREVHGLTTSAGIWMAAAIGVAVGLGELGLALLATILSIVVLRFVIRVEHRDHEIAGPENIPGKMD